MKSEFTEISLFGRAAYIFCCLEEYLKEQGELKEKWNILLDFLWTFKEKELDEYDYELVEHLPECVLEFENYDSPAEWEYLSEEKFHALYKLYQSCPFLDDIKYFLNCAESKIIGYNIYSGVQPPEWYSLEMMEKEFLPFIRKKLKFIPEVSNFSVFSISQRDCWNLHHSKEEIKLKFFENPQFQKK